MNNVSSIQHASASNEALRGKAAAVSFDNIAKPFPDKAVLCSVTCEVGGR